MQLNDPTQFRALDPQDLLGAINGLPMQLQKAWERGLTLPLPDQPAPRAVVLAGMGGSAAGADLLAAYAAPLAPAPLLVLRDYDLPAWASGPDVLVIASSYTGETEETLAAYTQARERGCRTLAITSGGRLARMALEAAQPVWQFEPAVLPRAAVGLSFGLLLAALVRLGLLPDPAADLNDVLHAMRNQQMNVLAEVPVSHNPAKRMAGQLVGRAVAIFAADRLEAVARRWRNMINENAKAWGQFEPVPEADHNLVAGLDAPEGVLTQTMALFLVAPSNHPRNLLRLELTRELCMTQGLNTDTIQAKGAGALAHMWTLLHFGDYVSYYLAMAYAVDPSPVPSLAALKQALAQID